ncbi:isopentenyl-diphosphate Delta-isomerase [Actinophytocola sp.]|jgi:isopentenyl-diphosphate delta-isomerase|uniref:isopentenyl-diphosphate Delta-isomerase n=1 Tax=Actinophytocola sp. TaxID=1872138 RepID=UPI002EDAB166
MERVESFDEQGQPPVRQLRPPVRRAFSCFVFTGDARLLLTMRGHTKKTWPGVWTNSCYGHPAQGESLAGAVARALGGELGLRSAAAELVLPAFRYRVTTGVGVVESELCPVYRVVTDEPPRPDPVEVGDFEWVGWADFVYAVRAGDITVPPWCRLQVAELSALGADPTRWPVADTAVPAA